MFVKSYLFLKKKIKSVHIFYFFVVDAPISWCPFSYRNCFAIYCTARMAKEKVACHKTDVKWDAMKFIFPVYFPQGTRGTTLLTSSSVFLLNSNLKLNILPLLWLVWLQQLYYLLQLYCCNFCFHHCNLQISAFLCPEANCNLQAFAFFFP